MRAGALVLALIAALGCRKQPGDSERDDPRARSKDAGEETMSNTADAREVVDRWIQAGAAGDAEAVWKAVDWGATGAVKMTRSMRDLAALDGDVASAAQAGVAELAAGERDRHLVANTIADILATLNEGEVSVRRLEGAERDELLSRLRPELIEGLPADVVEELEPRLARAREVDEVFLLESARGSTERVGVTPRGTLVLIPQR
jgi:hypothetical protein